MKASNPLKKEIYSKLNVSDVGAAVEITRKIRSKIAFLESQLKAPMATIRAAAETAPEGQIITEEYKIMLVSQEREYCDLRAAKAALGNKLKPFLSKTSYKQLRIS